MGSEYINADEERLKGLGLFNVRAEVDELRKEEEKKEEISDRV